MPITFEPKYFGRGRVIGVRPYSVALLDTVFVRPRCDLRRKWKTFAIAVSNIRQTTRMMMKLRPATATHHQLQLALRQGTPTTENIVTRYEVACFIFCRSMKR